MTSPTPIREALETARRAIACATLGQERTSTLELIDRALAALEAGGGHDWHERFGLTCCLKCGVVRRADGKNKPCPGIVRVGLRAPSPTETGTDAVRLALGALRPFAEAAGTYDRRWSDDECIYTGETRAKNVLVGHLRAAQRAIAALEAEGVEGAPKPPKEKADEMPPCGCALCAAEREP